MTKDQADMWARVAQAIGLRFSYAGESLYSGVPCVIYEGDSIPEPRYFNPPENPADERLLREWVAANVTQMQWWPGAKATGVRLATTRTVAYREGADYVTALGMAIDALAD